MAAFALARYAFYGRTVVTVFLAVGIFLPTTLGSVVVLRIFSSLGLVNNLLSLVLIYTAQATPLAVFILTAFFREVPQEILDAARVDGAGEGRLYRLALPLVRPALAAVAVLTMIPVWNDIWWPLILAPAREVQTLILGTQTFVGLYDTDWNALLSALTMAMIPVLAMFALFSKQLIRGITSGAIK
jgi:raffinose/stachyose/melibiose transport system permease protein